MMWSYNDWWLQGMGYGFHWLFMIAFWGVLIWGLIYLVRSMTNRQDSRSGGSVSALTILKERYARGELDKEAFESMRKDLE